MNRSYARRQLRLSVFGFALTLFAAIAYSDNPTTAPEKSQDNPYARAIAAATHGPAQVALLDQAQLNLPTNYLFIPKKQAADFLMAMGNTPGDDLLGMVLSEDPESTWMVVARFEKSGYIKDDDAKEWDADELLKSLKDGTEASNEERRKKGIPEFLVAGWVQSPSWQANTHRLVWSAETRDKVPTQGAEPGINYNTYALGREGYVSLNLVTGLDAISRDKPVATTLLSSLQFNAGKRYEDFNADTDHIAEYGLAALVGGVAAKKIGLLAVIAAFAVKFFKAIAIAVVAGIGILRKIIGGKAEG